MIFCVTIIYLSVDENKAKEVTCLIVKILLFDESLQLWFQVLMLGIIEHQTFISFLERYNCMVFACSKAINLIRMICQDNAFWQYGKVSQRKILLGKCLFVVTIPSCPIIARIIMYKNDRITSFIPLVSIIGQWKEKMLCVKSSHEFSRS